MHSRGRSLSRRDYLAITGLGVWNEADGAGTTDHAIAGPGGLDSRSAYIIPKDTRDANPNTCGDDESYEATRTVDGSDWVTL